MKKHLLAFGGFIPLALLACSSAEDPAPFASANDLASRLEADTGVKWSIHERAPGARQGILLFGPEKPVVLAGTSREETTRTFFEKYGALLPELGPKEGFGAMTDERDSDGAGVVRLAHVVPSTPLPIFDSVSAIHFDASGAVVFVDPGTRVSLDAFRAEPSLDGSRAQKEAEKARPDCKVPEGTVETSAVELGAYPVDSGAAKLAYRVAFDGAGETCEAKTVFVDARSGEVLAARSRNATLLDRGYGGKHYHYGDASDVKPLLVSQASDFSYILSDASAGPRVTTSRTSDTGRTDVVSTRTLGTWGDIDRGVSVDAHFHATKALEYFRVVHGRAGLDGRNGPVQIITNDRTGHNATSPNAYYSDSDKMIRFSGPKTFRGRQWYPFALSYDVVVHELAHGIVSHTSKLVYWGESGAINESFADVMGTSAEQWLPEKRGTGDFIIGRESTPDGLGFRDMANPKSQAVYGQSEDYQSRFCQPNMPPNAEDNCWVHGDSGIGNRAFALMTVGGETPTVRVARGLGFQATRYLWWQSVVHAGDPKLTWRKLAIAQGYLAKNLGFETQASVACAWVAVGVISRAEADPYGTLCAAPTGKWASSRCAGVSDGIVCSDAHQGSAYVCQAGAIAGAVLCPDQSKKCSHAASDWRASRDPSGVLRCH